MIDDETHVLHSVEQESGMKLKIGVNLNVRRVCEERRTSISFSY